MITNILFADNGSDVCQKAMIYVKNFALKFEANVTVIHLYASPTIIPSLEFAQVTPIYSPEIEDGFKKRGEDILADVRKEFIDMGINVSTELIRSESIGSTIIDICNNGKFDLLVIGKHHKTFFENFFGGSTSEHITHQVKCPVLVINEKISS